MKDRSHSLGDRIRRISTACATVVLAGAIGWWLHGAATVLERRPQEVVTRDLAASQGALAQERSKSQQLERQLAALRRQSGLQVATPGDGTSQRQELAEVRKALQRKTVELEELRRETKADESSPAAIGKFKDAEQIVADLKTSFQEERGKNEALLRDLAAARHETEVHIQLNESRQADGNLKLTQSERLAQDERARAESLAQDLAASRQELDIRLKELGEQSNDRRRLAAASDKQQAAAQALGSELTKSRAETASLKAELGRAQQHGDTAAKLVSTEQAFEREKSRTDELTRELEAVRKALDSQTSALRREMQHAHDESAIAGSTTAHRPDEPQRSAATQLQSPAAVTPAATAARSDARVGTDGPPNAGTRAAAATTRGDMDLTRLLARARELIDQRNISAARLFLERAADGGNAQALFELAGTYDPNMLAAWGTVGTQAEPDRAKELYAKALAGGWNQADARLQALQ